ncbi:MAG: glycosyltransferase family 39 protein [Alphaproteobacteria bacterium]|nr:glycosyltransferase family 39 protein [Alphaproteobacteria bacterium]
MSSIQNRTLFAAYVGGIVFLVLIGIGRIVATYGDVSQTEDEATHIAAGLEWLSQDTYVVEQGNPPLSRIPIAIGLYLDGVKPVHVDRRNEILSIGNSYERALSNARSGTLVFFALAALVVWVWAYHDFGKTTAFLAVLLFTNLPIVLAHAGLATTDMAATATFAAAIFAFSLWLRAPSIRTGGIFGLTLGLALLTKFSAILFLSSAFIATVAIWFFTCLANGKRLTGGRSSYLYSISVALALAGVLFWGGYKFSIGPISTPEQRPHKLIDQIVGAEGPARDVAYRIVETPILPAPEAFQGLHELFVHNRSGHTSYVLGDVSEKGFWYFFPVALAVKTPIPILLLALAGCVAGVIAWRREKTWIPLMPAVTSAAILVSVLPANINIGLRHILPIFPMLSILAAFGVDRVAKSDFWPNLGTKIGVALLLIWFLATSWLAHPAYLSYFNEMAGPHPEEILVDSDLDWGQDVGRLAEELKSRNIDSVSLALFTSADMRNFAWPDRTRIIAPADRPTGWVAASIYLIKVRGYGWLEAYKPASTIGNSIRLYFVPKASQE